jgi:hypothetical protein
MYKNRTTFTLTKKKVSPNIYTGMFIYENRLAVLD